jgi:predicted RND superfamily exporter protein
VLVRLAQWQLRAPWQSLLLALVLTAAAVHFARRLELRTRFDQLLPDGQPSVVELKRLGEHTAGSSAIFIVLHSDDGQKVRRVADALLPPLRAMGPPSVVSAEDGVQGARRFLLPRAGLFASVLDLRELNDELDVRKRRAVARAMDLGLEDDAQDEAEPGLAELKEKLLGGRSETLRDAQQRYPDGYLQSRDRKTVVIIVRAAVVTGELDLAREALARVKAVVSTALGRPEAAGVEVGYAGDLVTGLFEYGAVKDDLLTVGALGLGMILGVILLYYRRFRVLVPLTVTIGVGLAWTFGLTQLAIGHLNVATGFLVSIVAGNGINFGILYLSRYLEERRDGETVPESVLVATRATWPGTLAAALAAAAAYGSLAVTRFHGFKHFAFIGTVGMLCCWLASYLCVPPILVLVEKVAPIGVRAEGETTLLRRLRSTVARFEAPFLWLVMRAPRAVTLGGVALAAVCVVAVVFWLRSWPLEYDMRRMQNDLGSSAAVYRVNAIADEVLGASTSNGMVVLVDRPEQVWPLKLALEAKRDAAPPEQKPFERVHMLQDFVPANQAVKLSLLLQIHSKLVRARARGAISDADWNEVKDFLPTADVRPFGLEDLPEDLARPFSEVDGTRGRLVFIEPTAGASDSDLHYLLRWADSFRETRLPDGSVVRGSGRAVIFADILGSVLGDIPRAGAVSLALTVLMVLISFGRGAQSLVVVGSLLIGVLWLGGLLALLQVKVNFFNFVALPITFGIGADYALNLMQRYARGEGAVDALRHTGGAVILCSLTTTLGYLALLVSLNQAVRSLGLVAVLGEVACLLAAVLVLPAFLIWREQMGRPIPPSVQDAAASAASRQG